MSWRTRSAALLLGCAALAPQAAMADIFLSGDYALTRGEEPGEYEFTAAVPETVASSSPLVWPDGCRQTGMTRHSAGGRAQFGFTLRCNRQFRRSDTIRTPWKVDGGRFVSNVLGVQVDRALSPESGAIVVPVGETAAGPHSLGALAAEFLDQGLWHILMGWDHLAFVLCLALLARGRQLVTLVSCFTLGHSISLGLAFFDVIRAPVPPVEAAIALSIVFMAREALVLARGGKLFSFPRQLTVISLFGLLHGLGFATALGELGVREGEKLASLAFFNLGVEIGQLLFVSAVLASLALLRTVSLAAPARTAALYGVGAVGSFWMFERVAGFVTA